MADGPAGGERQTGERAGPSRVEMVLLVVVLLIGGLLRGGLLMRGQADLDADPDGYRKLARTLAKEGVLGIYDLDGKPIASAFRPPLYPTLLSCLAVGTNGNPIPSARVAILHGLLGLATIVVVFVVARQWQLGLFSVGAAAAVAVDPILLNQSTRVMTETLATLLAAVGLLALGWLSRRPSWWRVVVAAATLMIAVYCRPTFAIWTALAGAAVVWLTSDGKPLPWLRRPPHVSRLGLFCAFTLTTIVALAPWVLRNYVYLGAPIPFTTHGGYTVLLGNNPHFYEHLRTGSGRFDAEQLHAGYRADPDSRQRSEVARDRRDYRLARAAIRNEPGMFAWASLVRVGRLWRATPHPLSASETTPRRWLRFVSGGGYLTMYGLAVLGLWHLGRAAVRPPWLFGMLLPLAFTLVHTVYWSDMRMRAPMIPVLGLLAAAGIRAVFSWRSAVR